MRIENEVKRIVDTTNPDVIAFINRSRANKKFEQLLQFYENVIRVRKYENAETNEVKYVFTYKKKLKNNSDMELEMDISKDEFDCIAEGNKLFIEKERYQIPTDDEFHWELDVIFNEKKEAFLCILEVEMPSDCKNIPPVPDFLKDAILYEVKQGDSNYSNYAIAKQLEPKR